MIRFLRSEAGTSEYVPEAVGAFVGAVVAARLVANRLAGPWPVWLAVVVFAGVVCGLLPSAVVWLRGVWRSRRRELL